MGYVGARGFNHDIIKLSKHANFNYKVNMPREIVKTLYDFTAHNEEELTIHENEYLLGTSYACQCLSSLLKDMVIDCLPHIVQERESEWITCYSVKSPQNIGLVPVSYVETIGNIPDATLNNCSKNEYGIALYDYALQDKDELNMRQGDIFVINSHIDEHWVNVQNICSSTSGAVPVAYLSIFPIKQEECHVNSARPLSTHLAPAVPEAAKSKKAEQQKAALVKLVQVVDKPKPIASNRKEDGRREESEPEQKQSGARAASESSTKSPETKAVPKQRERRVFTSEPVDNIDEIDNAKYIFGMICTLNSVDNIST